MRLDGDDLHGEISRLVRSHRTLLHSEALVLYAGANVLMGDAEALFEPAMSAMPAMGPAFDKEQPGTESVSAMEDALARTACSLFSAEWADCRLQSCTIANLAVYSAFAPNGRMLGPRGEDGGHFSQRATARIAGVIVKDLPFDERSQTLDARRAAEVIEAEKPDLVMLGRSVIVTPDDIDVVVAASRRAGALTVYDASHVAGLIAGGVFPNPLEAGVDVMTSSTYKTLGAGCGSIVAGREREHGERFRAVVDGAFLANQDAARLAPILWTLNSALRGTNDAHRTIANADVFKRALSDAGLPVVLAAHEARTHQVLVPTGAFDASVRIMRALRSANIIVGRCPYPGRPGSFALRFGTQLVTRLGFGEAETRVAAGLVGELIDHASGGDVARLRADFEGHVPRVRQRIRELLEPSPEKPVWWV
jgi:glycine hydroxymethyltransferase